MPIRKQGLWIELLRKPTEEEKYKKTLTKRIRLFVYGFSGFCCSIAGLKMWNKELTASEVKEDYSGASVPFKYKGANQTDIVSGWDFTSGWTTTGGASVTDADTIAWSPTGNVQKDYSLQKGKSYRLRIVAGTIGGNTLMYAGSGTGEQLIGTLSASSTNIFEFTITNDIPDGELVFYSNVSGTTNITSVTLTTIGAVAEYDGSGIASDKWFDKSGNDLHGTVSGASVENAPAGDDDGLIYEEGTFTPAWGGVTSASYNNQEGRYTKVGNLVTFSLYLRASAFTASASAILPSGVLSTLVINPREPYP